jgi:ketosteroid isomerase-like protein
MSHRVWIALLVCLLPLSAQAVTDASTRAACEVWQRDLSFARSVHEHDAAAFAEHVADDAVFDANTAKPTHGRAAIVQSWKALIAGKTVRIDWYPKQVVVSADGQLAYSSGAYLFENASPKANPHYTLGGFATAWRRGGDGVWRAVFDGGDSGKPASDADVTAFRAARQLRCPSGI